MRWKLSLQSLKQFLKLFIKQLFFLPPLPTILISVPAYGLVIYTLSGREEVHPTLAYASYLLSAYALVITITGITKVIRWVQTGIKEHPLVQKALDVPFVDRYVREEGFRTAAALYQGFWINLFYAGIKLFSGIYYQSVWFVTLAVYYILLAVMRFSLLWHLRRKGSAKKNQTSVWEQGTVQTDREAKTAEWRRYRLCGGILLFMNVALAGIVVLVVHQNSGFEYPGMLIYLMAMYTFYATITAVWNVIKFRKYGSPVLSAAKAISLTAAMVSMLSLETAMLAQFGAAEEAKFRQVMTASTGAGVILVVMSMAVYMMVHATRQLKS